MSEHHHDLIDNDPDDQVILDVVERGTNVQIDYRGCSRAVAEAKARWINAHDQAVATIIELPVECCSPGVGCQSNRLIDRLRTWRDNSTWHHRWMANGPLWWTCEDCWAVAEPHERAEAREVAGAVLGGFAALAVLAGVRRRA